MKEIPLTRGQIALVDDEDFGWLSQWKWHTGENRKSGANKGSFHARRSLSGGIKIRMARLIMDAPMDKQVDHKNGNTLDNRRENLRLVSANENNRNRLAFSKTGFKGVSIDKSKKYKSKYRAGANINKKYYFLGYFTTPQEASAAYMQFMEKKLGIPYKEICPQMFEPSS